MESKSEPAWRFLTVKEINVRQFSETYAAAFNMVTVDAFRHAVSLDKNSLQKAIADSTHIGLFGYENELLGFCLLLADETRPIHGKLLLWINKIALSTRAQGRGYSVDGILGSIGPVFENGKLGFIGCCTQSSGLINKLTSIGRRNYPISSDYGTPEGIGLWTYVTLNINQVRSRLAAQIDDLDRNLYSNFGILKKAYDRHINVTGYSLRPDISQKLAERNFAEREGDMLVLLTEL